LSFEGPPGWLRLYLPSLGCHQWGLGPPGRCHELSQAWLCLIQHQQKQLIIWLYAANAAFFQSFHFHQAEDFDVVPCYPLHSAPSTRAHIRFCSRLIKINVNCPHRSLPKRKSISISDGSALWSHRLPLPRDAEFLPFLSDPDGRFERQLKSHRLVEWFGLQETF